MLHFPDTFWYMLSSNVPRGQRNWNKLCGWNVRANKEGYTRGMSTMTPFSTNLNLLIVSSYRFNAHSSSNHVFFCFRLREA